jgi:hypothetical protein
MNRAAALLAFVITAAPALAQTRTEELVASRAGDGAFDASTVGYLVVDTGQRQNYGSASLIDPCHIKTAAHMFRSRRAGALNKGARAVVSFGYERNGADHSFASTHQVTALAINPRFDPSRTQQPAHDVAIARIEPCVRDIPIVTDRQSTIDDIGRRDRRFAVVGFVPDKDLKPRLFAQRGCLWTGDGDALGILLNCPGKSGMSGGSVFMADNGALPDIGVFTSSVSVGGKVYGAFSPLSSNRGILP